MTSAHPLVAATKSTPPSLSDAVYADLAVRGYLDNVAVSFSDGKSVNDINLNETRHWIPASTVKLFAALYVYKLMGINKLSLYDTVTIDPKNVVPTELVTDEYPTLLDGDTVTVQRLLFQMITQSDNTSFNSLLDMLDRRNVNDYLHSIGLEHSSIGSKLNLDDSQQQYEFDVPGYGINTTTAQDYTKAFELIYTNKIPGSKDLFAILQQQKINNMLPFFLPKDVTVAHKTGDLDPNFHDGGIVVAGKRSYVVSIFTNAGDPTLVAHLSQLIYTRDYSLVGITIPHSLSEQPSQPLDPLVALGKLPENTSPVLGTTVEAPPPITAADLGITAADLSLVHAQQALPKVTIPADSPFHFFITVLQLTKKAFALGNKGRTAVDLQTVNLTLAEAKQEEQKGNNQLAQNLLGSVQDQLITIAHSPVLPANTDMQTQVAAVSETRFSLMGNSLSNVTTNDQRNQAITQIAQAAKQTIATIQPAIPEAINATSPNQKPLIGEIVAKTDKSITVKTAGGQQITIPTNNNTVQVRDRGENGPTPSPSLNIGTTVAVVGSTNGTSFTPSFILSNVPRELVAPQPVEVVKVNTINKTMVVSENGVPVQVNVGDKTSIKGADTNIPLGQIKPGDVVVVHGDPLTPIKPQSTISPTTSPTSPAVTSTISPQPKAAGPTTKPSSGIAPTSGKQPTIAAPTSGTNKIISSAPVSNPSPSAGASAAPVTPKVIQSTTIQIVQKAQDVQKSAPPTPQAPASNTSKPQSAPPAQPPASSNNSSSSNTSAGSTTTKNGKK